MDIRTTSDSEIGILRSLNDDEILANIGLEDSGVTATKALGVAGKNFLRQGDFSTAGISETFDDLVARGRAFFAKLWGQARNVVCALYDQLNSNNPDREWLKLVAEELVKLLGIGGRLALLVVQAAIGRGLQNLCQMKIQPA
ncbi:hypothetical protein [Erythrobacter sp. F6033]|uniref:hypothetical protein n=1 Tax=Erythrobacter sp. F6033 TaxID=2926401 RepID=UPI001FF67CFB|nr:hypothetical protein [Erythrobacter sp. F6033]MCK0127049.1 hypothetical protein [Erythrobacter sp. F6033]